MPEDIGAVFEAVNVVSNIFGGGDSGPSFGDFMPGGGGDFSGALSSINDIVGSVRDVVSNIKDAVAPVIQGVADAVHGITSTIKDINDSIIQPIIGPIQEGYKAITALVDILHRDLGAGIKGILQLPGDIANAFGSLDAVLQRSLQMVAANNTDIFKSLLVPALLGKDGATLGDATSVLRSFSTQRQGEFTPPPHVTLGDSPSVDAFKAWAEEQQKLLFEEASLPAMFFQWLFKVVGVLEGLAAQREPYVELWREEINKAAGVKKLDPGTVGQLLQRGELEIDQAVDELRNLGYSETRARAQLTLTRQLLGAQQIVSLFSRGWIDNVVAERELHTMGYEDKDVENLLASAYSELDVGTLLELVRRGYLKDTEAGLAMVRQGYRPFDVNGVLSTVNRLLGLTDILAFYDRAGEAAGGAGFSSLAAPPPAEFTAYASKLGVDKSAAQVVWSNHWQLLNPQLAVQAFFRGYVNNHQLDVMLGSFSIPPELRQNFIDLQRPLIPYRSITTLVSQGIIDAQDAMNILRSRGFDDWSANILVKQAIAKEKPSQGATAQHLHNLSQDAILKLYDAGTIADGEAIELLLELGYTQAAAQSLVQLHLVHNTITARQGDIDLVIAQVKAGLVTYDQAVQALGPLQLTSTEQNKALARITSVVTAHTKMPSESQLLRMHHQALLDDASTLQALQLLGYSESWAQLLMESEALGAPRSSKQVSTP